MARWLVDGVSSYILFASRIVAEYRRHRQVSLFAPCSGIDTSNSNSTHPSEPAFFGTSFAAAYATLNFEEPGRLPRGACAVSRGQGGWPSSLCVPRRSDARCSTLTADSPREGYRRRRGKVTATAWKMDSGICATMEERRSCECSFVLNPLRCSDLEYLALPLARLPPMATCGSDRQLPTSLLTSFQWRTQRLLQSIYAVRATNFIPSAFQSSSSPFDLLSRPSPPFPYVQERSARK